MEKIRKINLIVVAILLAIALLAGKFLGAHVIETRNEAAIVFSENYLKDYNEIIHDNFIHDITIIQAESPSVMLDDIFSNSNYLLANSININVNSQNTYIVYNDEVINSKNETFSLDELKGISEGIISNNKIYMTNDSDIFLITKLEKNEEIFYIVNQFDSTLLYEFVEYDDEFSYLYLVDENGDTLFTNLNVNSQQQNYQSYFKENQDNLYRFNGGYYTKQLLDIDNCNANLILFYNFIESNELSMFYITPMLIFLLASILIILYEKLIRKYKQSKYINQKEFKEYINNIDDIVLLLEKVNDKYIIINSTEVFNNRNTFKETNFENLIYQEDLQRLIDNLHDLYLEKPVENFIIRLVYPGYGLVSYYALPILDKHSEGNRIILSLVESKKIVDIKFRYLEFKENFSLLKTDINEIIFEYSCENNKLLFFNNSEEINGKSFEEISKEIDLLNRNSRLSPSNNFLLYLVYKEDIGKVQALINNIEKMKCVSGSFRLKNKNDSYNWYNMAVCGIFDKDDKLQSVIARLVNVDSKIVHNISKATCYDELLDGNDALEEIKEYFDKSCKIMNLSVIEFTNVYDFDKDKQVFDKVLSYIRDKYEDIYISKSKNTNLVICMKDNSKEDFIEIVRDIINNNNNIILSSKYKLMLHAACLSKDNDELFDIPNNLEKLKESVYQCVRRNEVIADEN